MSTPSQNGNSIRLRLSLRVPPIQGHSTLPFPPVAVACSPLDPASGVPAAAPLAHRTLKTMDGAPRAPPLAGPPSARMLRVLALGGAATYAAFKSLFNVEGVWGGVNGDG